MRSICDEGQKQVGCSVCSSCGAQASKSKQPNHRSMRPHIFDVLQIFAVARSVFMFLAGERHMLAHVRKGLKIVGTDLAVTAFVKARCRSMLECARLNSKYIGRCIWACTFLRDRFTVWYDTRRLPPLKGRKTCQLENQSLRVSVRLQNEERGCIQDRCHHYLREALVYKISAQKALPPNSTIKLCIFPDNGAA